MREKNELNNYLIFTDLDGTLLNHHDYSFTEANEMLNIFKKYNTPLIIVTSKTKEEVIEIQKRVQILFPFIIENGAGVFIPKEDTYELIALGKTYSETLEAFNKYANFFTMKGFHQMSDAEVSRLTSLSLVQSSLARKRTFSEPFILDNIQDLEPLKKMANEDGFDIVKGGRFYHLITMGQDKANALKVVQNYYEKLHLKKYQTIALGDGENDITMLQSVGQAIVIQNSKGGYINCDIEGLIQSKYQGSKGWNESLKRFFNVR